MHHACFAHFFAVSAQLLREMAKFFEHGNGKAINSTISVWTRARPPLFSSNINSLLLSNWATWGNREMVWKDAETIFQWRFHGRRRCGIVRSLEIPYWWRNDVLASLTRVKNHKGIWGTRRYKVETSSPPLAVETTDNFIQCITALSLTEKTRSKSALFQQKENVAT